MDLLLFLIRKHEIDIYDIPIELVLDQYLKVISSMKEVKLEVAGDFFVMAATLMEIKSRLLLPKQSRSASESEDEDADIDPRWELVHQLLEYKKFKEAADSLDKLSERAALLKERDYNSVNKAETPLRPLKPEDKISVWNSFNIVLRRLTEKLVVGEIQDDSVTVVDQMEMLIAKVKTQPVFNFSSLFDGHVGLRTLVTTFIAILELTRLRRLKVEQNAAFCDFIVTGLEGGESLSFEEENELEQNLASPTL
ncbi:segregation/condensation protein A [Pelagicoccus albus]|uniref:Segregation and condensation protein A n=2 Tax=Pelagicoccus albus TaxID=415222 RepID=A0A7X1B5Q9_9BACT|nr:segregation/condensation protein A [Pelagicoccus albus]MBC2604890.1 segregation/condensation protein A [Pelagicoccus albus]